MATGSTIVSVTARQVFSDRGHPGIETTVTTENGAKGVAVVVEATHTCMTIRGVRKPGSLCVTSAMKGLFRTNLSSRGEIMQLIYGERR